MDTYESKGQYQDQEFSQQANTLPGIMIPSIEMPRGGGAIKGIEEKFNVNAVTGTASFSVPIPLSPNRRGFTPALTLTYDSGSGNSPFGLGWDVMIPSISRKSERKLPEYHDGIDSDTFMLSGVDDLVPMLDESADDDRTLCYSRTYNGEAYTVTRFRPRLEGTFSRIEKWVHDITSDTFWKTVNIDNVSTYYGLNADSCLYDPNDTTRIYRWYICLSHDDKGNIVRYHYKKEDFVSVHNTLSEKNRRHQCTQTYIKKITYGNKNPYFDGDSLPSESEYMFQIIFDYGEHDDTLSQDIHMEKQAWSVRKDPFSSFRAGFEIRTYRRCSRIMLFHCFEPSYLPHTPYLVKSLELIYKDTIHLDGNQQDIEGFSYLVTTRQNGHRWLPDENVYSSKSLPELEFVYQNHVWKTAIESVDAIHAPSGLHDKRYLWTDLYNEGISGILTEQADTWYYQSNRGDGSFSPAHIVARKPSFSGVASGRLILQDLEANGSTYLVQYHDEPKGYYKLSRDGHWETFRPFEKNPNINFLHKAMRPIDLNGNGRADLLFIEDDSLQWYEGLGEVGFQMSRKLQKAFDEEQGPAIIFEDAVQSIFLADMTGDGLTDIVRIKNGEICYWSNLGYGRFSAKMGMENAPYFDSPEAFSPSRLRLADIDGSGTADVVYLGQDEFLVWLNLHGNGWTENPQRIQPFPTINSMRDVVVVDLFGTGTACIVCSSSLPTDSSNPMQYIDLMDKLKPHVLISYHNNCGKEVRLEYKTSTQYYLEDIKTGIDWITRLPFPVQCVSKVIVEDKISKTIFTNSYKYRHGYFDPHEREFRGFSRVERYDAETFSNFSVHDALNVVEEEFHQPPVKTISWFHTGTYLQDSKLLNQCQSEYFQNVIIDEYAMPEPILPTGLSETEVLEAARALKSLPLRQEIYQGGDGDASNIPFVVNHSNYEIKMIQPKGQRAHAVFMVMPSESIHYSYERNPADPRITHSMILEVDEVGNATKGTAIVYPRRVRPLGADAISDAVWNEQQRAHIDYLEKSYTGDIDEVDTYRLRVAYEDKSYDIGNFSVPAGTYLTKADLLTMLPAAPTIAFHEDFGTAVQKRLMQHNRYYYQNDTLTDGLSLGQQSPLGLMQRVESLAFTDTLVTTTYGSKVDDVMLLDTGYHHSEGDSHWWTVTSTHIYDVDPASTFYTPIGSRDPFGNVNQMSYDEYYLMTIRSTNPLGHQITAVNDYRTLSAVQVTDANRNRAMSETDELGFVVKFAVMGKEGDAHGDTLVDPTTRMEYDLFNWKLNQKPNYIHTFTREEHGAANPRWQETVYYSDGGGKLVMIKRQTEPGVARSWNPTTGTVDEIATDTRWIGNGRSVFNNKGSLIREFEPYFSINSDYENEAALVETGISTLYYYDALGRNIRSENPNGTFSRVEFDTWQFKSYDVNDTVLDSEWYAARGAPDPVTDPEPSDPQARAAWLAARHHDTPHIIHYDSGSRPMETISIFEDGHTIKATFLTDSRERFARAFDALGREISHGTVNLLGAPIWSMTPEQGEKWILLDVMGRIHRMWAGNMLAFRFEYDELHRNVANYVTQSDTEILYQYNVYGEIYPDADVRNLVGRLHRVYDSSGEISYDDVDFKGNALRVQRRLVSDYKSEPNWSVLVGLNTILDIEQALTPLLENETFITRSEIDALSRPKEIILPDNTRILPTFNEANLLETFSAQLRGIGDQIMFLTAQDYDARGQRTFAQYGNGLVTNYHYEPDTYRLSQVITKRVGDSDSASIQNLHYTYDPKGNVVFVKDEAQQTHFFQNAVVTADRAYEYNALYQLIKATGREHAVMTNNIARDHRDIAPVAQMPHPNDVGAVRRYMEEYSYDDLGNILNMTHHAGTTTWQRHYRYAYQDDPSNRTNRLMRTSLPGDASGGPYSGIYEYDPFGNMTRMPHLNELRWNYNGDLREVDLNGGGRAWYCYTSSGGRIRKVIERNGGQRLERIYLGALEIYREYQSDTKTLERSTLSITDDTGRVAQVDTKLLDSNSSDPDNPLDTPLIRYVYENHLGSAKVETNEQGIVISYEEYYPYGNSAYRVSRSGTNLSLKRYRFSRRERDNETGLYYYGSRYYAAWLGRWISCDRAGFGDGMNLYHYCRNNPIMLHDPNGTQSTDSSSTRHDYPVPRRWRDEGEARQHWEGRIIEWEGQRVRVHVTSVERDASSPSGWTITIETTPVDAEGNPTTQGGGGSADSGSSTATPQSGGSGSRPGGSGASPEGSTSGSAPAPSTTPTAPSQAPPTTAPTPPRGSPQGDPNGSPQGSAAGSPQGSPNGSPNGQPDGSPSGSGSGERNFWNRGGSALFMGLLLLGAGLLTIFTAGAATPVLVLLAGSMATAGGIALTTTSSIQLAASYSGATTAEQDARTVRGLHTVGALSSPGGLVGGTIGAAVADDPQQGLETGAMIGGVAELGTGAARYGLARFSSGRVAPLVSGDAAVTNAVGNISSSAESTRGLSVLVSHGDTVASGAEVLTASGWQPAATLASTIQSSPHGRTMLLMCHVGEDPAAVQSLANATGRAITAFEGPVSTVSTNVNNVLDIFGLPATAVTKPPQYMSPYLNLTPNVIAPGAATLSGVTSPDSSSDSSDDSQ